MATKKLGGSSGAKLDLKKIDAATNKASNYFEALFLMRYFTTENILHCG